MLHIPMTPGLWEAEAGGSQGSLDNLVRPYLKKQVLKGRTVE